MTANSSVDVVVVVVGIFFDKFINKKTKKRESSRDRYLENNTYALFLKE